MQNYLKTRYIEEKVMPSNEEVRFMEVIKKIVECAWIIKDDDMR
jgi:hypothetical protein